MTWSSDEETFDKIRTALYTAVVGDILDSFGCFHQFLPPGIRPLRDDMILVGRAMPVLIVDVYGPQSAPFGKLTQALDQLQPREVYVAGSVKRCASWGEILTATAKRRGASGAVIDGFHRDTVRVLEQNWPVFSSGPYAQDAGVRSQVLDYRCPIEIGGVTIRPGDLILGDLDGIVIVPAEMEKEVIAKALEKAQGERKVRREIESGLSSTAAFDRYGIL
ncbi:MAG TPA: RraA family protein [Terriglobales bacterium]|jgi:regulator of RNase E activity RraA